MEKTYSQEQLTNMVNIHECPNSQITYIRLADIPNPYRSQFAADSYGSTNPLIENEGPCAYSWDWLKWLRIRFRSDEYKPRFKENYTHITDEMCSKEIFMESFKEKPKIEKEKMDYNISIGPDYLQMKVGHIFITKDPSALRQSEMSVKEMLKVDRIIADAIQILKDVKFDIVKCGLRKDDE